MDQNQIKQQYLESEIISKGYDPNDFVGFLFGQKAGGDNINNWTLDEIKEVVAAYKRKTSIEKRINTDIGVVGPAVRESMIFGPPKHQEEPDLPFELQKQPSQGTQSSQPATESQKMQKKISPVKQEQRQDINPSAINKKIYFDKFGVEDREMNKTIEATLFKKAYEKTPLDLKIKISKPEVRTSGGFLGFGSTSKLWFSVSSNLLQSETEVKRADEDFDWLRNTLTRLYPGYIIPHLKPSKNIPEGQRRQLAKRMMMLSSFLKDLSRQSILFNNQIMMAFLTWTDYNTFSQFKKQTDGNAFHRILQRVESLDGLLRLEVSQENRRFLHNLDRYTIGVGEIYQTLRKDLKEMLKNYEDLTMNMEKVAKGFQQMLDKYNILTESCPVVENQHYTSMLIEISESLYKWGKTYNDQQKALDANLTHFFAFQRSQDYSIRELLIRRNEAEEQYLRFRSSLLKKKEKVFADPQKWQLSAEAMKGSDKWSKEQAFNAMLPRETEQQSKLKDWLGYLNKRSQLSFIDQLPIIVENYKDTFRQLGTELVSITRPEAEALTRLRLLLS